jgi:adenosine deaminase
VRDLTALPKVDLHAHFQGSVRIATLRELARATDSELPPGLVGDRYEWRDFFDFLTQYGIVSGAVSAANAYYRVAYEICEDYAAQGVPYAEVTLSLTPQALNTNDWDGPLDSALDGFEAGRETFGTQCRVIVDHPRGFPIEYATQLLDTALRHRDRGVVALGLAGPEAQSGAPVAEVFRRARAEGMHSVPHAGEATSASSIREALDLLEPERIGHGIKAVEDEGVLAELRDRRIPLEVCPTSNVVLGNVASFDDHPLLRLIDAGVVVTLNSDDPAMFHSDLLGEYEAARSVFGITDEGLADLARAGVRASFADDTLKNELETDIDRWLAEPRPTSEEES